MPAGARPSTTCSRSLMRKGSTSNSWSVEHGVFGGHAISGTHWNPTVITTRGWLLDFYNGGGLDESFLAMGEVDGAGNVNVGRLGDQLPGPAG